MHVFVYIYLCGFLLLSALWGRTDLEGQEKGEWSVGGTSFGEDLASEELAKGWWYPCLSLSSGCWLGSRENPSLEFPRPLQ